MGKKKQQMVNFELPGGQKRVLVHSCCAPCVAPLLERMQASKIEITVYFYNPNIHPKQEYEMRKQENIRFCKKNNIPFVDADYDVQDWFDKTKGHENDPERGARCTLCFDMRFIRTAQYASENQFKVFTSSLGISRWKNFDQITQCGVDAANQFNDLTYWEFNWRKQGGSQRMIDLAKEEEFYQQQYCGCVYSLRDSNRWRQSKSREKIELGKDYYSHSPNNPPNND